MKVISVFLALINSLLAGLLITFLVSSGDLRAIVAWSFLKILIAVFIITVGLLSWINMVTPFQPGLLMLGSLFLVAVGPATMVWTLHRATVKGDLEYYLLVYGASLFVQGVSLILGLSQGQDKPFTV